MSVPVPLRHTPVQDLLGTTGAAPDAASDLIDFSSLFQTLWRGKLGLVAAALAAGALGGGWAAYIADPQFRASAMLVMAPETVAPTGLEGVVPGLTGDSVAVNTEVEILRSRTLLRRLAAELGLTVDPEFNPLLRPATRLDRLRAALPGASRPRVGSTPAMPGTVDSLESSVVVRSIPDSRVFEITAESLDPAKAARIANTLADLYLADQIALKQDEAARATDWLTDRVAELQIELESADSRSKAFAADMELVSLESLQALAAQLKDIRQRIATRDAGGGRDRNRVDTLRVMETELASQLGRQSQDLVKLGQMQLEAEASRLIYEHFLGRLKEASVQRGVQKADSRILTRAEVPLDPARPQPLLIALIAAFTGAILAAAQLVAREARADVFRTADALERATGRPVLGRIPELRGRLGLAEHMARDPASFAAESVRNLRTALTLTATPPPQVILITSSMPGEGKSTLTLALGQNIAAIGKRVLVIQADIKRRPLRRVSPTKPQLGLLAVLEGRATLAEAVRGDAELGIDILPAEPARANASDLLSSRQVVALMAAVRQSHDVILIDTPPVLAVADARLLGKSADAILYAVGWDTTSATLLRDGLRALQLARLPVTGLILSRIDHRKLRRYGHDRSFGAFGSKGYYRAP